MLPGCSGCLRGGRALFFQHSWLVLHPRRIFSVRAVPLKRYSNSPEDGQNEVLEAYFSNKGLAYQLVMSPKTFPPGQIKDVCNILLGAGAQLARLHDADPQYHSKFQRSLHAIEDHLSDLEAFDIPKLDMDTVLSLYFISAYLPNQNWARIGYLEMRIQKATSAGDPQVLQKAGIILLTTLRLRLMNPPTKKLLSIVEDQTRVIAQDPSRVPIQSIPELISQIHVLKVFVAEGIERVVQRALDNYSSYDSRDIAVLLRGMIGLELVDEIEKLLKIVVDDPNFLRSMQNSPKQAETYLWSMCLVGYYPESIWRSLITCVLGKDPKRAWSPVGVKLEKFPWCFISAALAIEHPSWNLHHDLHQQFKNQNIIMKPDISDEKEQLSKLLTSLGIHHSIEYIIPGVAADVLSHHSPPLPPPSPHQSLSLSHHHLHYNTNAFRETSMKLKSMRAQTCYLPTTKRDEVVISGGVTVGAGVGNREPQGDDLIVAHSPQLDSRPRC